MIQIVFGSLDTDYDLITGLYDIGCPALHTVFTYPVRLKFGTADLLFGETESGAWNFFDSLSGHVFFNGESNIFFHKKIPLSYE